MITDKIIYLSPTFFSYRVPVFDQLYQYFGEQFLVVSLEKNRTLNGQIALSEGKFPRKLLKGNFFSFVKNTEKGNVTPGGVMWAPGLVSTLLKLKPKVVISNNFNLWTLTSIALGFPTIVFWEGTQHTEATLGHFRKKIRKLISKKAKMFVVNGILAKQYLINSLNVTESKILVGGMCASPVPPQYLNADNIVRDNKVKYLFVGRLIDLKGISHLLEAIKILKIRLNSKIEFELIIVGDGPEKYRYIQIVKDLGIQKHVKFIGYTRPDEIWKYYAEANVFIFPSIQDNWPLVVLEAMSLKLPILLSKYAGSITDLLQEGKNGYSFDPLDHNYLASLMEKYAREPELIKLHGLVSSQIVEIYNPINVANVFIKCINLLNNFNANI